MSRTDPRSSGVSALPSLNGLRVFEAAARHRSFTLAARELHVTPGAVSQQMKVLEAALGTVLFRRANRALTLTAAGETLLPAVADALGRIAAGIDRVRRGSVGGPLTVSVPPSFGTRWLVPRLERFRGQHADIEVRMTSSKALVDFTRGSADVAVRRGRGLYEGLRSHLLLREYLLPVCSPRLLQRTPLRVPEDVGRHTLLHHGSPAEWRRWARLHHVHLRPAPGRVFDDPSMVLRAAVAGQGLALGRSVLLEEELADGRLVQPLGLRLPSRVGYYLVYPEELANVPKVRAFRRWLLDEAHRNP